MTTIMPEAFDRTNLIYAINEARASLNTLSNNAENDALRVDILRATRKNLQRLLKEIDQKVNLLDTPGRI